MNRPLPPQVRSLPEYLPVEGDYNGDSDWAVSDVPLREYWRIVVKYRVLIAAMLAVCVLLGLLYAFTATPIFEAQTKVRISSYQPILASTQVEEHLRQRSLDAGYLETQIQEIKSYSVADRVLLSPIIKDYFQNSGGSEGLLAALMFWRSDQEQAAPQQEKTLRYSNPVTLIERYLDRVSVSPIRRTALVWIRARSESPDLAAEMANAHAEAYIDWVRESRIREQSTGLSFLRGQAQELRERVADLEREMADYAEENSIVAVNKDENITAQRMARLNQLLTDATAKRIEAEHDFNEAKKALDQNSAGFDDPSTQRVRSELASLQSELDQLREKFTDSYPRVQQLRSRVAALKKSVQDQREQIVSGLQTKAQAALREEENLREELEQQKSRAFELSKRQVQYNILNRELTSSRDLLQNVLRQIKETALTVESNSSNVAIVDPAIVPKSPSAPKKLFILAAACLIGLGLGLGLAFLLSYLDNTVRTPEDIAARLGLPALGVVPSFELDHLLPAPEVRTRASGQDSKDEKDDEGSGAKEKLPARTGEGAADTPVVYLRNPKSLTSEAYRTIRTGILLSQAGEPPRTIMVSSSQSAEGKTTSSINLGASLASTGGRVLLIDADLRRPSVHSHFEVESSTPGLAEVLTGQASVEEVKVQGVVDNLTFVFAGQIPPNPAELLGSREMMKILDQFAAEYDYVIIDSPPILPVTDSVVLSRYVDGVVLVVKGGSTPTKVINDAKRRLQGVGARLLGVVLNDVDVTSGDYYYYSRYYHSYYEDEESGGGRSRATG